MKLQAARRLLMAHKVGEQWKQGVRGYHQAIGALILARDSRRFLFQLRSSSSDTPETYGCYGGSVDGAEELNEALFREIQEETSYVGPFIQLLPLSPSKDFDRGFTYYNNLMVVPTEFEPKGEAEEFAAESAGYAWTAYGDWPQPLHPGLTWLLGLPETQLTLKNVIKRIERGPTAYTITK